MIGDVKAKGFVGLIVGLYALTVMATSGFAHCVHHERAFAASHSIASGTCLADAAKDVPADRSRMQSGCGDCVLSEPAWIREARPTRPTYRAEIVTRQDFVARLGRNLGKEPQDTRSRAPPRETAARAA